MFGVTVQHAPVSGVQRVGPTKRTQSPIVTGTSVLGVKVGREGGNVPCLSPSFTVKPQSPRHTTTTLALDPHILDSPPPSSSSHFSHSSSTTSSLPNHHHPLPPPPPLPLPLPVFPSLPQFKGGVLLAADTLASYGSLARFKDVQRLSSIGDYTVLGAGGEFSDFQALGDILGKLHQDDLNADDGFKHSPSEIFNYLRAIFYSRRNKFNPLWNEVLVAGFKDGKPFLGQVDMIGTAFEDNVLATGFGSYLALPIMRSRWHEDLTEGEARALLEDSLRVLFYRDCRALNRIQIAKATEDGVLISEPYTLETVWDLAAFAQPKAGADTDGSW